MKKILAIAFLFTITGIVKAQCNCQEVNRSDGAQVTQCKPLPVAFNNTTQVGLSAASNGEQNFVSVTVRFKNEAKKIKGDLSLRLENQSLISLQPVRTQLAYIGNSEVSMGIFASTTSEIEKLKKSKLVTISFELTDDMIHTYQAKKNTDILIQQLTCL